MLQINEVEVEHFYRPTWPTIGGCKVNVERALVLCSDISARKLTFSRGKHYALARKLFRTMTGAGAVAAEELFFSCRGGVGGGVLIIDSSCCIDHR